MTDCERAPKIYITITVSAEQVDTKRKLRKLSEVPTNPSAVFFVLIDSQNSEHYFLFDVTSERTDFIRQL